MDPFFVLFSLGGRLPRLPFWVSLVGLGLLTIATAYALLQVSVLAPGIAAVLAMGTYMPAIWIGIALGAKRLHDRDMSAGWLLVFALLPALLSQIANRMAYESSDEAGLLVVVAIGGGLVLWGFVEIAFLPGTKGDNRFGPDPLQTPPDALD